MTPEPNSRSNTGIDEIKHIYDEATLDYIRRVRRGTSPDPKAWIEGYPPTVRPQLLAFLEARTRRSLSAVDLTSFPERGHVSLDAFVIEKELGSGGMGVVFSARDALGRPVAIKFILESHRTNPERVAQFWSEARLQCQLQHPGVPTVYQFGNDDILGPFIVMEPIRGGLLSRLLQSPPKEKPSLEALLDVFLDVSQTVAYAHEKGYIHCDLKPENVMVGTNGEVWVMDWGLGIEKRTAEGAIPNEVVVQTVDSSNPRSDNGEPSHSCKPAKTVRGTPMYMPPEQAVGDSTRIGPQSDVFALGAILCQIITGSTLYSGTTTEIKEQAAAWAVGAAFERLDGCGNHPELIDLCKLCLSKLTTDRPADGGVVAKMLSDYRAGVETRLQAKERDLAAAAAAAIEQRKKRRWQLGAMATVGLLLLASGGVAWWYDRQRTAEQQRIGRNQDALEFWVERCEEALRTNEKAVAKEDLKEIERRLPEGGGEAIQDRIDRCRTDLALLQELDRIDDYQWKPLESRYPSKEKVAAAWKEFFQRFGIVTESTSPQESAQLLTESLVRDRLLSVLDLWFVNDPTAGVRAVLGACDRDEYREAIREAILAGKTADLVELVGRPKALEQPARYAAVLGQIPTVPEVRSREVLKVALRDRSGDLTLLMTLGETDIINLPKGAEEPVRWFQAAVAAHPRSSVAHYNLGQSLRATGDLNGAIWEIKTAIELDPKDAIMHIGLGSTLKDTGDLNGAICEFRNAIELDPKNSYPHNVLGHVLSTNGELDGAIREFKTASQLDPKDSFSHTALGNALDAKGDPDGAIRAYNTAIGLDPKDSFPHTSLGTTLGAKGDTDGAIREFKTAIGLNPKDPFPHTALGAALGAEGDTDGAIREYNTAIELYPKLANAHTGLGYALVAKGDTDCAIREFKTAIQLDPKDSFPHTALGKALGAKGDTDGAIREFKTAIQLNSKDANAHTGLGFALNAKGDPDGAIREFKTAIQLDPKDAHPHNSLGGILNARGDPDGAIREFKTAIQLNPKVANFYLSLGLTLKAKGDWDGAIREFKTAIQLDPKDPLPHNGLGSTLHAKGNVDGAIREFYTAIGLNPKLTGSYTDLGLALRAKGELEGAICVYKIAIELDPKDALPHNGLGGALNDKGDKDGAIREYKTAIELKPKLANPHTNLGLILLAKDDADGAIQEFKTAIQLDPSLVLSHIGMGLALQAKSDFDGAIREYKTAIELKPKDAFLHDGLGLATRASGDRNGAITAFREAAQLKYDWAPTYRNLAILLAERGEPFAALQALRHGLRVNPLFLEDFRYNLACYACLVASGQAKDAPPQVDRPALRCQAFGWLTDELAALRKLSSNSKNRPEIHKIMQHWLIDPELESVRDLEKLPVPERESWAKFWTDVRLLRENTTPESAPPPRLVK
jgi:eukaryotic-like serine/threonine-protein kinase